MGMTSNQLLHEQVLPSRTDTNTGLKFTIPSDSGVANIKKAESTPEKATLLNHWNTTENNVHLIGPQVKSEDEAFLEDIAPSIPEINPKTPAKPIVLTLIMAFLLAGCYILFFSDTILSGVFLSLLILTLLLALDLFLSQKKNNQENIDHLHSLTKVLRRTGRIFILMAFLSLMISIIAQVFVYPYLAAVCVGIVFLSLGSLFNPATTRGKKEISENEKLKSKHKRSDDFFISGLFSFAFFPAGLVSGLQTEGPSLIYIITGATAITGFFVGIILVLIGLVLLIKDS